ncbi:glycosyltransferase [Oceanobacillus caeni]
MIKVTIGVPNYNSEKYISQGLDSFEKQTMNKDEFEVLIVDDCSTDNSLDVINSYKDKLNITVKQLPENSGGPGAPRNKIIEHAKGEYIFFVDSDDYIHKDALNDMYNFAKENNSDVLLAKMKGVNGRGAPQSMFKLTESNVDLYNSRIIYTLSPTKMFRTSLLRDNNIYFPIGLKSAEDQIFTMRAYLQSNVISVLSDKDYYYATAHEGPHMNSAYVSPNDFYKVMSDIVDEIYATNEPMERKDKLTAEFLNRHFNFSRTKNFSIKNNNEEEKEKWMRALSDFIIDHVPNSVDMLTASDIQPRIIIARNRNLHDYESYERALKQNDYKSTIKDGQVYAVFDCLQQYTNVQSLNFTKLNKMTHNLKDVKISDDRLIITCHVSHSKLSNEQNENQQIYAVLVHRDSKDEKYINPTIFQPKSQKYTFEIPYEGLLTSVDDIGTWDLFMESRVDSYVLRGRIGNKRDPYQYKPETSYIGSNHKFSYRLTPYFTKPYDNFSIYTIKLDELEKKGKFSCDKKAKRIIFTYPKRRLIIPDNSRVTVTINSVDYSLSPNDVIWVEDDTQIIMESSIITKIKELKELRFDSAKINGLDIKF